MRAIASTGFPNYFGRQRFGGDGANAERARAWLRERRSRRTRGASESIQVSALRSLLFNEVLATRIRNGTWLEALPEDAMMLDGTRSFFAASPDDAALAGRIAEGDVHVSGPLWGKAKRGLPMGAVAREREWLGAFRDDLELLEAHMLMARRPLRARALDLGWRWVDARTLEMNFALQSGSYATALLDELFSID
jgi:tRNA pseudouridine13 synthase